MNKSLLLVAAFCGVISCSYANETAAPKKQEMPELDMAEFTKNFTKALEELSLEDGDETREVESEDTEDSSAA